MEEWLSRVKPTSNEGLFEVRLLQLWYHTVCVGALKLGIVKCSIGIRRGYCRLYVGLGNGFTTGNSFRTTPVQVSVKRKWNKGVELYALDPSTLSTSWYRRGVLDGVIIPKLGVLCNPDFSREGQVRRTKE